MTTAIYTLVALFALNIICNVVLTVWFVRVTICEKLEAEVRRLRDGIKLILADPATLRANILRYGPEGYDVCHRGEIDNLRADKAALVAAIGATLKENAHLAAGDNCTLFLLKAVLAKHAEGGAT